MRNKKRILPFLLVVTLLLMVAPVALAACVGDNHTGFTNYSVTTRYISEDALTHQVLVTTIKICSCGEKFNTSGTSTTVNHSPQSVVGPHLLGKHTVTKSCSKCSYFYSSFTVFCSGPPCIDLY